MLCQEEEGEEKKLRKINVGDYIIIQRQKYTKLHKFGNLDSTAMLGKEQILLRNIAGHNFCSTFRMISKDGKAKRCSTLEICTDSEIGNIRDMLGIQTSGMDNRNIIDDGESQNLTPEDIDKLKEECEGSSKILEKIVENSKTFHTKTEYSQEKYLKKKEKKYFEFVQIREPTIRLMAEIFYRQDSEKIMNLRMDSLSQIISYSGVSGFGNYLLYESGSNGLLPAVFLNSIGADTEGKLVHMHPGNVPQKQALLALNLPEEQIKRCISVNIYSVLREFYQGCEKIDNTAVKRKCDQIDDDATESKKIKLDDGQIIINANNLPKWHFENKVACEIMREKFDALVIVAKEHPQNIIKALLPFVKPSRPIVIFSSVREVLTEIYVELKATTEVTNLHLTSNWMRLLQILPNRTHPEVNMNGNSGYILTGLTVR